MSATMNTTEAHNTPLISDAALGGMLSASEVCLRKSASEAVLNMQGRTWRWPKK